MRPCRGRRCSWTSTWWWWDDLGPFFDLPGDFFIIRDDDLFRAKPLRKVNPDRDRFLHSVGNSSVFRYRVGDHGYVLTPIWRSGGRDRDYEISQQFQSAQLAAHGNLHYWPKGWCVSFKNDCVPRNLASYLRDRRCPRGKDRAVRRRAQDGGRFAGRGHKWYRRIGDIGWLRARGKTRDPRRVPPVQAPPQVGPRAGGNRQPPGPSGSRTACLRR